METAEQLKSGTIATGRIALLGASGAIGKSIVDALTIASTNSDDRFVVIGRGRTNLEKSFGDNPKAEIRTWDTEDSSSIREALIGIDTAVYMIGINYWEFHLHPIITKRVVDAAKAAGVKRLLLIATQYPFGRPRTAKVNEDHPREPHTYKGKKRKEQEDIVLAANVPDVFDTAILRLPDFYGPGVDKSFLWSPFVEAKKGGSAQLVGPIDKVHEFVFVPDVGPVVARLLEARGAWGHAWNLGGADHPMTQKQMVEEIYRQAGAKPRYMVAGKGILRLMGLFNPMMREMVEMNYLFSEPIIVDDTRLMALLGDVKKTPYAEGIRQTLASMK